MTMADIDFPLRKEFYVFWKAGLPHDEYFNETVAVCMVDVDKGETTITRVFHATGGESARAEDLLLEWLFDEPFVQNATDIEMRIYLSYSPQGASSDAFVNLRQSLEDQEKKVKITVKFVELYKAEDGEEDAEDNRNGLRALKTSEVKVDVFREADWLFLMDVLTDKSSRKKQLRAAGQVKRRLKTIFKDPKDVESITEHVIVAEVETMTDEVPSSTKVVESSSDSDADG